jgi:hypothetical protein
MNLVKKCNGTGRIKHQLIAGLLQLGDSGTTRAYIHPPQSIQHGFQLVFLMYGISKSAAAAECAVWAVSSSVFESFKEKSRVQTNKRVELQRTQHQMNHFIAEYSPFKPTTSSITCTRPQCLAFSPHELLYFTQTAMVEMYTFPSDPTTSSSSQYVA